MQIAVRDGNGKCRVHRRLLAEHALIHVRSDADVIPHVVLKYSRYGDAHTIAVADRKSNTVADRNPDHRRELFVHCDLAAAGIRHALAAPVHIEEL